MAESTAVIVEVDEQVWLAQQSQLGSIRAQIRRWLRPLHLTEDTKNDMVIAVNAAVSNAIEHAYKPATSGGMDDHLGVDDPDPGFPLACRNLRPGMLVLKIGATRPATARPGRVRALGESPGGV